MYSCNPFSTNILPSIPIPMQTYFLGDVTKIIDIPFTITDSCSDAHFFYIATMADDSPLRVITFDPTIGRFYV
jgi:hypothetical protein